MYAFLTKFKHNEPDKFLVPLAIHYNYPALFYMAFLKSTTSSTDMVLTGTDESYIGLVETYLDIYCNSNSEITVYKSFDDSNSAVLQNSESLVSFTDFQRNYEYLGRHCYTPTGVSPYCTIVATSFKDTTRNLFLVTNQDRYYNDNLDHYQLGSLATTDSASLIEYKNGNASVAGKFIVVAHTRNSFGSAYE